MFDIKKRLSLSFLGEGWKDCYIEFRPALVKEMAELASLKPEDGANVLDVVNKGISFLKNKFVGGRALKDGKIVELKNQDIEEFPIDVLNKCFELFGSELDKKK